MKCIRSMAILLWLSFSLINCASKPATGPTADSKLKGTWELNYVTGPRIAFDGLYPNQKPTLIFSGSETEVSGNTSCNGFSAPLKVTGNRISFGDVRSTMMACDGIGESTFKNTLRKITAYSLSENTLTLLTGDIAMMRFTKSK